MYYCKEKEEVIAQQQTSSTSGLSETEASARLERNGKNKLVEAKKKSLAQRFLEQLSDPMIIILIVAALISGVLAVVENDSFTDTIIILVVVIMNAVLGVFQ